MASRFGENSLRNSYLAFIQVNFHYRQRRSGIVDSAPAYYASGPDVMTENVVWLKVGLWESGLTFAACESDVNLETDRKCGTSYNNSGARSLLLSIGDIMMCR
ncbi:hypothetical protein TNCV_1748631 [Trichonephila clavipes]|nr:hypothetical protein TNCV_1748631 [Trichonephila clavipes]